MAKFTVQLKSLVPNACFVDIEADTPAAAARAALDTDTDNWEIAWEDAGAEAVTAMWRGDREYVKGNEVARAEWDTTPASAPAPISAPGAVFTAEELATVLAALRYWQREGRRCGGHERDIASDNGQLAELTPSEIDDLCERLNRDDPPAPLDLHTA